MTTSHTPGRLHVAGQDRVQIRSDKHQIAKAWSFAGKTGQENARRLVACWNSLHGILTTEIEAAARSGSIAYALSKVIAQRDELLDALKHIEGVAMADEWRDLPEIAKHARAAIAKAEGGEA